MFGGIGRYWASKIAGAALQFALPPIAVAQLGVTGFARYSLMLQAGALLKVILIEPVVQYAVRDYTTYPLGRTSIAAQTYGVLLLLSVAMYPLVDFGSSSLSRLTGLSALDLSFAFMYGVALAVFSLGICFTMCEKRMGRLAQVELGYSALVVLLPVSIGAVFPSPTTYVLAVCLALGVLSPMLYRPVLSLALFRFDRAYLRGAASFGGPLLVSALLNWIVGVVDRFQISAILGLESAGTYTAAYQILVQPLNLLTAPLFMALHPFLYQADRTELKAAFRRLMRWLILISVIYVVGCVLFASYVIDLIFANRVHADWELIVALALAGAMVPISQLMLLIAKVERRTTTIQYATGVSAIVVVVGNAWALPRYGVVCAAVTTIMAYIIQIVGIGTRSQLVAYTLGSENKKLNRPGHKS